MANRSGPKGDQERRRRRKKNNKRPKRWYPNTPSNQPIPSSIDEHFIPITPCPSDCGKTSNVHGSASHWSSSKKAKKKKKKKKTKKKIRRKYEEEE